MFPDTTALPNVTVAYTTQTPSTLPAVVRSITHRTANVQFERQPNPRAVRDLIVKEKASVGLILPTKFDDRVKSGNSPRLLVIVASGTSAPASYVAASLDTALRGMAGQKAPAVIQREVVRASNSSFSTVVTEVGLRSYFVVVAISILIVMISIYVLPSILTEETEKGTLSALILIASHWDVIGAKALIGILYATIGIPLLLLLTRIMPVNLSLFVLVVALFSVSMVGAGLFLAGLFDTTAQVNTWSSLLMLPFIFAATLDMFPLPSAAGIFFTVMPSSQTVRLALDGLGGRSYYGNSMLSILVIAAWARLLMPCCGGGCNDVRCRARSETRKRLISPRWEL
jgi:hypothetical protein